MERYESYKDSGVEWIGEIPFGWNTKKIKHNCYVKARVGWKGLNSSEFLTEGYAHLITGTDFKKDKIDWNNCYYIHQERYDEDPYIQLKNLDLLITKDGTIGKLAVVTGLEKPACLNSGIFVVRSLNRDFSTRYLFWLLKSNLFAQFNNYTSYGSTIQHLYQNVFVEFSYPQPTFDEQAAIASYLDHKTAEIDALIVQKERLIELYEEEKTAIINHAVTKGIDSNVKLKDSGVDWLGEIPENWQVLPLRRLVDFIKTGGTPSGVGESHLEEGGYSWYAPSDFSEEIYLGSSKRALSNLGKNEVNVFPKMTVMMVGIGATIGKVGISIMESSCNQQINAIFCNKEINPIFCAYYLKTLRNFIVQCGKYTTMPIINQDETKSLVVSLPPVKEQENIVHHIEYELDRINIKIAKTQHILELQKEYSTAMISEVVTGKVKVSHLAKKEMAS